MIIDNLRNSALYEQMNPLFKQAFDYLKSLDLSKLEAGKTVLIEGALTVMVNDTNLKTKENAKLEVHDQFIDIQMPVSTNEAFGWKSRQDLTKEKDAFNTEKDIQFFEDAAHTYFELEPGNFAILFPQDGHAPCVGSGPIRKIIVKVKA